MTGAEIYNYQMSINPWSKDAEFTCYELLDIDEFNKWFEKLGADDFFSIYDYSELTAKAIINNLISGAYDR